MPLSSTQTAICDKMVSEFDNMIGTVEAAKTDIMKAISDVTDVLDDLVFSAPQDLLDAISDFGDNVDLGLPNLSDIDEIFDMINACNFLSAHDNFSNPIALINSATDSVLGGIKDKIDGVAESIPEFNAGGAILELMNQFTPDMPGSMNVSRILAQADGIIECISSLCGPAFAGRLSTMTSTVGGLYSDLGIVSDPLDENYGKLDTDAVYSAAGLSPEDITAMTDSVGSMTDAQGSAIAAKDSVIDTIKGMF